MATTASTYISKINTAYPQAGKNNNTQGFRDNFSNIQLSLSEINNDVENLQLTSVSTAGTSDFGYNTLYRPNLKGFTVSKADDLESTSNTKINYENGNYQVFNDVGASVVFELDKTKLNSQDLLYELTIKVTPATTSTVNFGLIPHPVGSLTLPVTITTTTFFDLWTDDAGINTYVSRRG